MPLPFLSGRSTRGGQFAAGPAAPAVGGIVQEDALIGWWKFDETSGSTAADSSDTGNAATLTQSGSSDAGFDSSGKNGYCAIFDGTDDEATIPSDSAYGVTPFSITAWINVGAYVANASVIQSDNYTAVDTINLRFANAAGKNKFDVIKYKADSGWETDTYTTGTYVGAWHHMALVVTAVGDGTFATAFYWDGSVKSATRSEGGGSAGVWTTAMDTGGGWQLGRDRTAFDLNGRIDDVRIYDVALTTGNVEAIYNSGDGDWP